MSEQNTQAEKPKSGVSPEQIGHQTAVEYINTAISIGSPAQVEFQLSVLYCLSVHILGSMIFNEGIGNKDPKAKDKVWDSSRGFAAEKEAHDYIERAVKFNRQSWEEGRMEYTPIQEDTNENTSRP